MKKNVRYSNDLNTMYVKKDFGIFADYNISSNEKFSQELDNVMIDIKILSLK